MWEGNGGLGFCLNEDLGLPEKVDNVFAYIGHEVGLNECIVPN